MARNIRWMIPFKTLDEKNAVINIYKEGNFDEVIKLEPAYNTFETQESTDEELMNPIRTHTGYIRIIDNGDISGLMPSDNRQHYVEFLIEGDLKWCGYMQADTFSEDWDITPLEVEFPVISGIGILDSIPMDQNREMDLTSLCSLLLECIDATGVDYNYIYIPKEVKESAASEFYLLPLDLRISRFNFFKVNNSVNTDDPDWERYDADTYSDLLEELCKFWGWTIHERGRDLYLVSTRDVDYMKIPIGELQQKLNSLSSVSYESVPTSSMAVSDMKLAGNSHKKDILQGYNKIEIKSEINTVDEAIPKVDFDSLEFVAQSTTSHTAVSGKKYYERLMTYVSNDPNIKTYIYKPIPKAGGEYEWERTEYTWENIRYKTVGATFVKRDAYEDTDLKKKRNYNFSESLMIMLQIHEVGVSVTYPTIEQTKNMIILQMSSAGMAMYNSGAFVISANTSDVQESLFKDWSGNGKGTIELMFRVGENYWGGSEWVKTPTWFVVNMGNDEGTDEGAGQIISTKTLDMPYNGADGYVIPINQPLSGQTELSIHAVRNDGGYDRLYLAGLTVDYYKDDRIAERKDSDENEYSSKSGIEFSKDLSVELKLATNNNNPAAYSILFNSPWAASGSSAEILYFVGEGMKRPEEYLLSNLKRIYGRITEKLTLQMEREDSVTPLMRLTRSGKRYILLSENVNWSDGTVEYIIEDLP